MSAYIVSSPLGKPRDFPTVEKALHGVIDDLQEFNDNLDGMLQELFGNGYGAVAARDNIEAAQARVSQMIQSVEQDLDELDQFEGVREFVYSYTFAGNMHVRQATFSVTPE